MKNVIVTGSNGFIGSSLIKKLIEKGTRVVAVDITFHGNRLPDSNLITRIESGVNTSLVERLPVIEYVSRSAGAMAVSHIKGVQDLLRSLHVLRLQIQDLI